jgi:enterochelin esterase-like enzyme
VCQPAGLPPTAAGEGAWADDATATFRVADPGRELAGVRLQHDMRIADGPLEFARDGDGWLLVLDRPPLLRLEYLLELRYPGGGTKVVTDPANPRLVAGAFGPKSVLEFPGYAPPGWLTAAADPGSQDSFEVPGPDDPIVVRTWSPTGARPGEPLPLLIAHDGPEYDSLASLTGYLGAGIAGGWLPLLRAALLSPGRRSDWYAADPRYARALCRSMLPALAARYRTSTRIGMGPSLGALAMLHAHCRYPGSFDALFLQSGSFFTPDTDSQDRPFPHFRRIVGFVGRVLDGAVVDGAVADGSLAGRPVPVSLTCGAIEWNAPNNAVMAAALTGHGYPAVLHEVADTHNYTAWRDAFDPHLTRLLAQVAE